MFRSGHVCVECRGSGHVVCCVFVNFHRLLGGIRGVRWFVASVHGLMFWRPFRESMSGVVTG